MREIVLILVGTGLLATGCASPAGRSGAAYSRGVLASEEIRQLEDLDSNAYDLIQRVRPEWLRSRGSSFTGPFYAEVFLDGARYGGLEALRQLSTRDIREIQYHDSRDATTLYGTGYPGGVVDVRTRP